eukprot:GFYU01011840.1.p1 GENE.GFYU01011840.1~~GFYU01011840.1.p1  ORF type:complete len:387 (-),score=76.85 GFYU01011840.1:40-1200(-)
MSVFPAETHDFDKGTVAMCTFGDGLMGKDKWLGGELAANGMIYGIPGTAPQVLKIDPTTGETSLIGPVFPEKFKWLRGIHSPRDNCIYGIPSNATSILRIDPSNDKVSTFGGPLDGVWKWHGGVMAADGNIYCIPCCATSVLKIVPGDPEKGLEPSVEFIGVDVPELAGNHKWYGGLLGCDGCVYGIPNCAKSVVKINPATSEVTTIGDLPSGGQKWHGGVTHPDGCVYGVPSHHEHVLRIDPRTGDVTTFGDAIDPGTWRPNGKYKYGGATVGPDNAIYCFPSDAERVLKITPSNDEVKLIGPPWQCHNKWQNGFVGRDSNVYAIPCNADGVLRIECETERVDSLPVYNKGYDKWEGGVVGLDGDLYCMPQMAKTVLKVSPAPKV